MNLPALPPPPGFRNGPVWTGRGFQVDGVVNGILSYAPGESGWTEELTGFHEAADDETHYINVASREHAVGEIEQWVVNREYPVLIDIGCSSGYTVKLLRARLPKATVIGADFIKRPLEKLWESYPDLPLMHFDLLDCPLPENSFDGVILLNVLEHVREDAAALSQIARILKPDGIAAIEVPAGPDLYDIYDKQLLHFRRYRMREFVRTLQASGLRVVARSHLGCFLYPGFWIIKKRNQRYLNASSDIQKAMVAANMRRSQHSSLMNLIMRAETQLRRHVYLPFGIRCLVTCRKA